MLKVAIKLFLVLLVITLVGSAQAQFSYTTNNGAITITGYTGPTNSAVVIPDSINGLPVTRIGFIAFYSSSITSVSIPAGITNIDSLAFGNCLNLTEITIHPANLFYSSPVGVLFDKFQTTLIQFPAGKGGSYTVPATVTSIASSAFTSSGITNVSIPNTVTNISGAAFESCHNLVSVNIPSAISRIEDLTFRNCTSLTNIYLPTNVTSIGWLAFSGCRSLAGIDIPNTVNELGTSAFSGCTSLTSVTIPSSVITIGPRAFASCPSLTNIVVDPLNNFYSSLDGILFNKAQTILIQFPGGKSGVYSVPNGALRIGPSAFAYSPNLTGVVLPVGLTSIGTNAFSFSAAINNVSIPQTVTNIEDSPCGDCPSLTAFSVHPANPYYSSLAGVLFNSNQTVLIQFPGAKAGSYDIPNSVKHIGYGAFAICNNLTALTIPDSVVSLGRFAFQDCDQLKNVIVGNGLTNLADSYFAFNESLAGVYFRGNAPKSSFDTFWFNTNIVYYLPGTLGWSNVFAERPTALWLPAAQTQGSNFGMQTNRFGFNITWASGLSVVVEASTNLLNPIWTPVQTNTAPYYFSDADSINHPARFYRLRSP